MARLSRYRVIPSLRLPAGSGVNSTLGAFRVGMSLRWEGETAELRMAVPIHESPAGIFASAPAAFGSSNSPRLKATWNRTRMSLSPARTGVVVEIRPGEMNTPQLW